MTRRRKLTDVEVIAREVLSDDSFCGVQSSESLLAEVDRRATAQAQKRGEVYERMVQKKRLEDATQNLVNKAAASVLKTSTTTITDAFKERTPIADDVLWNCWLKAKGEEGEEVLIRWAQAGSALIDSKIKHFEDNLAKQQRQHENWKLIRTECKDGFKAGLLFGDVMRQLGLVYTEKKSMQS